MVRFFLKIDSLKYGIIFIFAFCLISCNAVRVNYDYEKTTNFSSYTTYNYFSDIKTGLSELDGKRLFNALDNELKLKGLLLSEEPDILINIQSKTFKGQSNNNIGVGIGGTGGSVGGGISVGLPIKNSSLEREIVFEFIDAQKNELIWQAITSSSFRENSSPEARAQKLHQIVTKILAKYPPKNVN